MPELYEGENLQRAAILAGLPRPSVFHELLKITIYQLSNCLYSSSSHWESWKHINDVICWSGLMRHRFNFSALTINDISISAFVENLFGAAVNSDTVEALETITWLLSCGYDPNNPVRDAKRGPGAFTALQISAMQRRPDLLRLLLDQGADPDLKFSHKQAPLEIVLAGSCRPPRWQENKLEMAHLLISRGANVNNPVQHPYPSILALAAAKLGDAEFLKLLVGKGADLQQTMMCNNGFVRRATALSCAAGFQDEGEELSGKSTALAMLHYLLEAHATINCRIYPPSDYITADVFITAALADNCDVIRLLFSHSPTTIATSNSIGITPLLAAVNHGRVQVCKLLAELGCPLNSMAGDLSPLMLACQEGKSSIVSLLAQMGASTNEALPNSRPFPPAMDFFWGRKIGLFPYDSEVKKVFHALPFFTPLRLALVFNKLDCAINLLDYSAKPLGGEMRLVADISPWFQDYPDLVSALVKAGGDPREHSEDGNGIIAYLMSRHYFFGSDFLDKTSQNTFESIKFLLHNGAHLDGTELPKALQSGDWRLAELLIQFGASTKASATLRSPVLQSVLLLRDSSAFGKLSQDYPDLIQYTPGSLCAAVQGEHDPTVIYQLLKKRPDDMPLRILEATAVGIAIWKRADTSLVHLLDINSSRPIACKLPLSQDDLDIYANCDKTRLDWFWGIDLDNLDSLVVGYKHEQWGGTVTCRALEKGAVRGSLLTYAVLANDEAAFLHLIDRGFKPDRSTWLVLAYNGLVSMALILLQRQWGFASDEKSGIPEELPLVLAIYCRSKEHRTAMVQYLLTAGFPATYAKARVPPLWIAAIERELGIVQLLIDFGADVNAPGLNGKWTLLHHAVWRDDLAIVLALIDARANVKGELLHAITQNSCLEIVNALIRAGADVDAMGYERVDAKARARTPLQHAVEAGQLDIIHILIKAGADVNAAAPGEAGATALQFACITGQIGIAKHLIELGADVNALGSPRKGRTALEGAAEHGRIDIMQLLLHHGAKTTDDGRRQFIRSIALAENQGHMAASKMLRAYGEWEVEDEEMLRRVLEEDGAKNGVSEEESESEEGSESEESESEE